MSIPNNPSPLRFHGFAEVHTSAWCSGPASRGSSAARRVSCSVVKAGSGEAPAPRMLSARGACSLHAVACIVGPGRGRRRAAGEVQCRLTNPRMPGTRLRPSQASAGVGSCAGAGRQVMRGLRHGPAGSVGMDLRGRRSLKGAASSLTPLRRAAPAIERRRPSHASWPIRTGLCNGPAGRRSSTQAGSRIG